MPTSRTIHRLGQFEEIVPEDGPEQTFDLPADLSVLADEDLARLETDAVEAFDSIRDSGELTDENLVRLRALSDAVQALRTEAEARIAAAEEAQRQIEELANAVHPADEAPAEGAEAPAGPGNEAGEAAPPPAEAVVDAAADGEPDKDKDKEAVAAAGAPAVGSPRGPIRVNVNDVVRHASPSPVVESPGNAVSIRAAADLPGVPVGAEIDMDAVVRGFHDKARSLPDHSPYVPVASIDLGIPDTDWLGEGQSVKDTRALFDRITGRDAQESMLAAGGWCAPSIPLFDLFSIEAQDGLISLPTFGVERGGVQIPVSPSFADVVGASTTWTWTEQNDIDAHTAGLPDPTKPCFTVPCTTWTAYRLTAYGICVTAGNLQDRAYPELTRRYLDLIGTTHAHFMSQTRIAAMVSGSTAVTIPSNTAGIAAGAIAPLLNSIELQAEDIRYKYAMSMDSLLEVVLPHWALPLMRADVAYRFGSDADDFATTDALLASYFSDRHVAVQYVQDWQRLGGSPATDYPSTVVFLIYPAGTWSLGSGGSLDLGVVRDSVLNATNDFTAAWSEEFTLLAKIGPESRAVTVAALANGQTGSSVVITHAD